GWLYRTTCFAAAQLARAEGRRQQRLERLANMDSREHDSVWEQIVPLLEAAINKLNRTERDAVLLRFMEGQSFDAVGQVLGMSEEAARKRVHRAVEKLRTIFARHGVTTSSGLLMAAMSANALETVPTHLAASVALGAIGKGAALTTATSSLVKGTIKLMAWT